MQHQGEVRRQGILGFPWVGLDVEEGLQDGHRFKPPADEEEDGHDAAHHVPQESLSLDLQAAEAVAVVADRAPACQVEMKEGRMT